MQNRKCTVFRSSGPVRGRMAGGIMGGLFAGVRVGILAGFLSAASAQNGTPSNGARPPLGGVELDAAAEPAPQPTRSTPPSRSRRPVRTPRPTPPAEVTDAMPGVPPVPTTESERRQVLRRLQEMAHEMKQMPDPLRAHFGLGAFTECGRNGLGRSLLDLWATSGQGSGGCGEEFRSAFMGRGAEYARLRAEYFSRTPAQRADLHLPGLETVLAQSGGRRVREYQACARRTIGSMKAFITGYAGGGERSGLSQGNVDAASRDVLELLRDPRRALERAQREREQLGRLREWEHWLSRQEDPRCVPAVTPAASEGAAVQGR